MKERKKSTRVEIRDMTGNPMQTKYYKQHQHRRSANKSSIDRGGANKSNTDKGCANKSSTSKEDDKKEAQSGKLKRKHSIYL
jgi:hypothetical protein